MRNPFKRPKAEPNIQMDPDTDPIYVTHNEDPSLDEDEMIIHTFIEPDSTAKETDK
jgi:hypothetical protein